MAVAELFIGAFITVLCEKLTSVDFISLAKYTGVYTELNKWGNTLTQIEAVLVDAGQKDIRDRSVQLWLNKLHHLAYEIDDVLDDLATEAMRQRLNQESSASVSNNTSKVIKFVPTKFHVLRYSLKMSSKLDSITTKLHDLVEEKSLLGLNDNVGRSNRPNKNRQRTKLEETSLVDESKIIGRQDDKEALVGKLLGNESSSGKNVSVVSIVGLGGIGKTTLARLLYNEEEVKSHFELMSWVCVSDEFDVFTISKAIYKDIGGDDNKKFETLNQLQVSLTEKLSNKKFLLVLDDVWNENYNEWELFQRPFTVGAPGSKILVTTRKTMVASVMDSGKSYHLELLSNEDALSLLAQYALGKPNFDSRPTIKLHAEGIVKKCGGIPLALRTLGWMLRTKSNDEEWEELLNNPLWSSRNGNEILPALRLSYYDLEPHLKPLFAYCCLFPKDYMFDKKELVLLWMAEGLVYKKEGDKSMETLGEEYFGDLVSRSFFQLSTNDKSRYIMHDLVNDLAMSVAGEFFFILDDKKDVIDRHEALEKLHHFSFIRERYGSYKKFKALQRAKHLRTFLAISVTRLTRWDRFFDVSNKVLVELLPQLRFLRVLSLTNYNITEIPQSIGSMKHLRYLNFSNTKITCLPENIGDLNLQSLLVSGCRDLCSLPNSIIKLINLRHLDITHTPKLNKIPLGISRLTSLQTLSKVIIGEADEFKIYDLKGLLHIQGQLSIEGLQNVKNSVHAREANIQQKKGISDLHMQWSDVNDGSRNETTEYEVLEALRPSEKLTSLKIVYYMGTTFPRWVGDHTFASLTHLTLRGCKRCTILPTLGNLPSLQKLFLESMYGLKRLGPELLVPGNSCHRIAFRKLEVLEFKDMKGWEEWSTKNGEKVGMFPCLREMSIINCPKLDVVAVDSIPSLMILSVEGCSLAVLRSMVIVSSSIARLTMKNIKGITQLHGHVLEHLKDVEYLNISECDELTYLWETEAEACKILVRLRNLEVRGCARLLSFGEKEVNLVSSMASVKDVRIEGCPKLEGYNYPNSIEKLVIDNCSSITSLNFPTMDNLVSTLKFLDIRNCDNLEVSWLFNNFLVELEFIYIWNMPNLRLFPIGCLVNLTQLTIFGCDNLESIPDDGYGFLPLLCLRGLKISFCKNMKSFPHKHLHSLTSLKEMDITKCPSLDCTFPCGSWPPNLSTLRIGDLNKPMSEWGLQSFPTSLVELVLDGENSGVVSFAKLEEAMSGSSSFFIPSSLTTLKIGGFMELESLSKGMQHLTCLQHLGINRCPKLRDLPETVLPSLSSLSVDADSSPKLRKKCRVRKGKYWPIISQIPHHFVSSPIFTSRLKK